MTTTTAAAIKALFDAYLSAYNKSLNNKVKSREAALHSRATSFYEAIAILGLEDDLAKYEEEVSKTK